MITTWSGTITSIFYPIQFEHELSDDLVGRIANALIVEPIGTMTAEEEYSILCTGLRNHSPLPTVVEMKQSPRELFQFLSRVVERMDALRPWAHPEYVRLPSEWLSAFEHTQPIARIALSSNNVSARLARGFFPTDSDDSFLLLRLRSGAVIGLFSPYWKGSDDVMVANGSPDRDPMDVLRELVGTGRLDWRNIFLLGSEDPRSSPLSTRYETTPITSPFWGEHLVGNSVWAGKQVKYLDGEERWRFKLFRDGGLLRDFERNLFDTTSAQTLWTPQGGRAIFAMDHDGNLYSAPFHILGEFHHSSFLAGAPVAGAGEIAAHQGKVLMISDHSTHYRPARRFTRQVLDSLRRHGAEIGDHQVEYHSPV
ncbi:hypothetical protein [Nocardia sp. XZ_19_231]|uniref:hypothetical protein n=1 Tax=Nocardia sp. XZ_19_231 TaxID=2769252 RepID=UPI00188FD750|nr:hypothetical protein [Nocardia sp. XZ_19_231]